MRILAIFAHPDDEIGCVGTLAKHAARGDDVLLVWTTLGELASQFGDAPHAEVTRVRQEHGAWVAARIGARHTFFDMGDSRLTGSRAEALQVAKLYAAFRPDAVITWDDHHAHPDHRMTARIAFDAVTLARIPKIVREPLPEANVPAALQGPGLPESDQVALEAHRDAVRLYQYHSPASPYPDVHVDVTDTIDVGTEVFAYYRSFYGWAYSEAQYLEQRAFLGRQAGVRYAERFNVRAAHRAAVAYLP